MLDAIAHRQHRNPANVLAALKTVTAAWDEGKVILQLAGPLQASKDETSTGSEMACKEMASPVMMLVAWPVWDAVAIAGPIEYAESGDGAPVLVVHGVVWGVGHGLGMVPAYLGPGFRVLAVSRGGHGMIVWPLISRCAAERKPEESAM